MVEARTTVTPWFGKAWDSLRRPVWLYNPQTGHQVYANPAALTLWAAESLDEFLSRDYSPRTPAVRARIQRLVDLTVDGNAVNERWTVFPNGQPVTTQATASAFQGDGGETLLLFEAEPEEVHADELRAGEALRHASALISLFDPQGAPLFANPAVYRAYGCDSGDFASRFVVPDEGMAMLAAARGAAVNGLHAVVTPKGSRWHQMDARPVQDPVSGLPCVLLNEQDVTPQVLGDIARKVAEHKADRADARQRFLTEASHELRTPLNAIIGFSGLLAEAGLDPASADQAARVHEAGLQLRDVVNQMIEGAPGAAEPDTIPLARVTAPAGPEVADPDRGGPGEMARALRALYVDDNDSNRTLVQAMLATMGITCETASDGGEGVEAAAAGDWDVILMDIQMPVMDGIAACRRIRALTGVAGVTPIIAVTANTLADQLRAYTEAGMNDCIAKPVDMIELLTKTTQWATSGWRRGLPDVGVAARG